MDRLLQCVEKLTIYVLADEGFITPDNVRQLHLPMVRELCLDPYTANCSVQNYPLLCDMILQSFPAHLNKVTFSDLRIGNSDAALILGLLRTDNHLKTIRYLKT